MIKISQAKFNQIVSEVRTELGFSEPFSERALNLIQEWLYAYHIEIVDGVEPYNNYQGYDRCEYAVSHAISMRLL